MVMDESEASQKPDATVELSWVATDRDAERSVRLEALLTEAEPADCDDLSAHAEHTYFDVQNKLYKCEGRIRNADYWNDFDDVPPF